MQYGFSLILFSDPNEAEADHLYSIFDDGTIATIAGVPRIDFHRSGDTLFAAIQSSIADVERGGAKVVKIELDPNSSPVSKAGVSS